MTIGVPDCGIEADVFLYMDVMPAKAPSVREKSSCDERVQ
jgi:hypothetical protein